MEVTKEELECLRVNMKIIDSVVSKIESHYNNIDTDYFEILNKNISKSIRLINLINYKHEMKK